MIDKRVREVFDTLKGTNSYGRVDSQSKMCAYRKATLISTIQFFIAAYWSACIACYAEAVDESLSVSAWASRVSNVACEKWYD